MNQASDKPNPDAWRGYIMLREDVEELTGQTVHPEVFSIEPTGNLIHVLVEEEPEEYGSIIIPKTVYNAERMGVGYIIAVGPVAGNVAYAHNPGSIGVVRESPPELLGLHVIFAAHMGVPLRVSMLDKEFRAAVLVMSSKDIRGVDQNPDTLTGRAVERSKK
jgi:hypothetical protein